MNFSKLDNPAWFSLAETHRQFAIDYDGVKFYKTNYCPFGGFVNHELTEPAITKYASLIGNFFVIGEKPAFGNDVKLNRQVVCKQMILNSPLVADIKEEIVALQTPSQKLELFSLVNLVQPGFFGADTADLGQYFGIYKGGQLVAAAGERMKMDQFSEVSAVVTHPAHTGRGYATQLITHTTNVIFEEKKIPYLHVIRTNVGPIALYEKLGFVERREINFWNLQPLKPL